MVALLNDGEARLSGNAALELHEHSGTPSAVADYGKIYTKSDNLLYFQDGAGVEHTIGIVDIDNTNRLTKLSTTSVAFNAVAATTLYTVPTGKIFIPVLAIIRAGADAALTDVTFGKVGALTDWLGTIQLDNLDAAGDQVKVEQTNANPPLKSKTYAAAVVFQIDVTVAQGGATNYVDLFGYLIDE